MMTGIDNGVLATPSSTAEMFIELVTLSPEYGTAVLEELGLEKLELNIGLFSYYRNGKFLTPFYLIFERPGFFLAKYFGSVNKLISQFLFPIKTVLNKVKLTEGPVYLNLAVPSLHLEGFPQQLQLKLLTKDIGPRFKGLKPWICVGDEVGVGASPSLAMMNAGLAPECSSVYLRLKKIGMV